VAGPGPAAPPATAPDGPAGRRSLTRHRLADDEFDEIAAGRGDLATLRAGQLSRRMLLVQALAGAAAERRPDLAKLAELDASLALLRAAHRAHRAEVDRLLLHPQVGMWGMRCLRLLFADDATTDEAATDDATTGERALARHVPGADDADDLTVQLGCFGTLAATAAMLTGRASDVVAHTVAGGLPFPTLGLAVVPGVAGWVRIRVRFPVSKHDRGARHPGDQHPDGPHPDGRHSGGQPPASPASDAERPRGARQVSLSVLSLGAGPTVAARFTLDLDPYAGARAVPGTGVVSRATHAAPPGSPAADPARGEPRWLPLRALVSEADGRRLVVDIDDLGPFRSFHHVPPMERLADDELAVWRGRLDEAWGLLVRHHPERAVSIAAALRSLVPLRAPEHAEELSASSADAFGAVALTLAHSGLALAATLVHELAHCRLSALLDLVPLFEPDRRAVHFSPWRRDPRHVPGLTQGAFAFLTLTDFWNDHRRAAGAGGRLAQFEYARWRAELPSVLDTLTSSGVLTGLGKRFIDGMRCALAEISDGEVSADAAVLADLAGADHRITWRLRNVRPRASFVAELGAAWRAGHRCPPLPASTVDTSAGPTAATGPTAPDELAGSAPRFVTQGRLGLSYLRLRTPERFAELVELPHRLSGAVPAASPADLLLLTGRAAAASAVYRDLIVARPDRLDLWAGLALSRRAVLGENDPLVRRPEVVLALHAQLRAGGTIARPDALADWIAAGPAESRSGPTENDPTRDDATQDSPRTGVC
jgi:hypothetical protein